MATQNQQNYLYNVLVKRINKINQKKIQFRVNLYRTCSSKTNLWFEFDFPVDCAHLNEKKKLQSYDHLQNAGVVFHSLWIRSVQVSQQMSLVH